jgi:hypothetical protein
MPVSQIVQLFYLSTFLACGFALWKGGAAERVGSIVILFAMLAPPLVRAAAPPGLVGVLDLVIDGLVGIALLMLTLRHGSVWLGVAMLLYAGQFALHSFYFVTQKPADYLHAVVNNLVFLGVSLTLWVGAIMAWLRQRQRAAVNRASPPAA